MGMYNIDPSTAERKAKVLLTFWATFTNRIILAKTLWKHADQPIHLALVLSMMIERLSVYANETTLKLEMEESSKYVCSLKYFLVFLFTLHKVHLIRCIKESN